MAVLAQRYYSSVTGRTQHYLNLSLSGGACLPVTKGEGLTNQIGADGQVAFSYEVAHHSFFFNVGVGAQYELSRRKIDQFVDATLSADPNLNPVIYRYVFNDFAEQQHTIMMNVPIQFGYYMTNNLYLAVGAKLQLPFYGSYKTSTMLYTEGQYPNLMEFVSKNVPSFGYYPEDEFVRSGNISHTLGQEIRVAPGIEFGGVFSIKKRLSCRLALYAEYGLPVVATSVQYDLVDYSSVASAPGMRTMDNLKENIAFYPITLSRYNMSVVDRAGKDIMTKASQNIAAGIRFTLHLNVSKVPKICNCVKD